MDYFLNGENMAAKHYSLKTDLLIEYEHHAEEALWQEVLPKGFLASAAYSFGFSLCDRIDSAPASDPGITVERYVSEMKALIERLEMDKKDIENRFFDGREMGEVTDIRLDGSGIIALETTGGYFTYLPAPCLAFGEYGYSHI